VEVAAPSTVTGRHANEVDVLDGMKVAADTAALMITHDGEPYLG